MKPRVVVAKEKHYNTEHMLQNVKRVFSFLFAHKIYSAISLVVLCILIFIFRPKAPLPIATQKIEPGDFKQVVSVSGAVAAKNSIVLTFPINGTISWIGVKAGDTVKPYQTLATLDQRTVLKNLQQALLTYSIQRNTFDQTIDNNGGTKDPSQAVNDAEKRILQNNQYNLDAAVNSVELQDLARQQSILTTPIAGIVTKEDAAIAGATAVLGSTAFTVVDPSSVVFNMDVDEADIGKIMSGQEAQVVLDAYPQETLTLPVDQIDFVSHATANGGNAYTVDVKLTNNAAYKYRVGMNGNADIITAQKHNVLTVSLASLINNSQVYVKTPKGFVKRTVQLGLQSDTDAVVTSGLRAGDVIAIDPTQVSKQ